MISKKSAVITIASVVMITAAIFSARILRQDTEMEFAVGNSEYKVNGVVKQFNEKTDNMPFIDEKTGKLMMPLRFVIEEMGGTVEYDEKTKEISVKLKGSTLKIKEGSLIAAINDYSIILDEMPQNVSGCLYVSADIISNNFSTEIDWNDDKDQITLKTEMVQRPIVNKNTIEYESKVTSYFAEVPVITGLNDKNFEKQLNNSSAQEKADLVKAFMKKVFNELNTNYDFNADNSYMESRFSVYHRSSELISLVFDTRLTDLNGKEEFIKSAQNIDLQKQKNITLSDIFKSKKYKSILEKTIKSLYADKVWADFKVESDENFYITDKSMVLFILNEESGEYNQYIIPFSEIKKYIKNEYGYLLK